MPQVGKSRLRDETRTRRANILDEAIRIVGERGYYGFAVQDLAGRCGLTTAGLLYHFKTKEELFLAVLEERDRRAEAALMLIVGTLPTEDVANDALPLPAVYGLLRAMMEITAAQPELSRLFVVLGAEALHESHPGHGYFRQRAGHVIEMFARIVKPHVANPLAAARQLSALMLGLQHQWLGAGRAWDLVAEWDRAVPGILPQGQVAAGDTKQR